MTYPSSQWLIYGDPGSGKSHFAATFPKPLLVFNTDPRGKAMPYLGKGSVTVGESNGVPCHFVANKKGENIITVEYYQDIDIKGGSHTIYAYEQLEDRITLLHDEIEQGKWATVVLDSLSFLEYQVRKLHQYKLNPKSNSGNTQDARQWYNSSAEVLEEFCYSRLSWLPINVVVLAHIRDTQSGIRGHTTWTPEAPGVKGRKLPGAFAEVYVVHSTSEGRSLQTENDTSFIATTQIMAPDGCEPHYKALWSNWDATQ